MCSCRSNNKILPASKAFGFRHDWAGAVKLRRVPQDANQQLNGTCTRDFLRLAPLASRASILNAAKFSESLVNLPARPGDCSLGEPRALRSPSSTVVMFVFATAARRSPHLLGRGLRCFKGPLVHVWYPRRVQAPHINIFTGSGGLMCACIQKDTYTLRYTCD